MKNKADKEKYLKEIKKEIEIHSILEELLPEMGFKDVKITHEKGNTPEYGKDVICSKIDDIEDKKDWYAFVVKKGRVSGSTGVVREIDDQVNECFQYSYKSLEQKVGIPINKVKVVTNEHFSNGAKEKILEGNKKDRANIDFWDGEKLLKFIDKYYNRFWIKGSKDYKKYIEEFQGKITTDNYIKSLSIDSSKIEKLLSNIIEPKLSERVVKSDGSIEFENRKVNSIVNLKNNSIIVGEPGCGKTTLFKELCNEVIEQNSLRNNEDFYPIIITFREVKTAGFSLETALFDYFKINYTELLIDAKEILMSQRCVVFIDALDELGINEDKKKALESINEFNEQYPDIKIISSSRPSDEMLQDCESKGFRYLSISDLNRHQVEVFLTSYFSDNLTKSKSLLKSLKDSEILEKLPKTPLTIALITMLFDEKEVEIPATITDLYEMFVNLLIGKSDVHKTSDLIEIGVKHRVLCYVAKSIHTDYKSSLSVDEFKELIKEYSDERGQKLDVDQIFFELTNQIGLLYKDDKYKIRFKHQSFQEYFTAYEIFHHRQSDRKLFTEKFNDLWWQNVAIFYAGMTKDSPKLLDEILENNTPTTLQEIVANIGGIGKLLQALYNTPIDKRRIGIELSLKNVCNALKIIENDNNPNRTNDIVFFQNFSKYGLMQVFGGWFKHNFSSITLKEPLTKEFFDKIKLLEGDVVISDTEGFEKEFKLYLITSILATDTFLEFKELRHLVEKGSLSSLEIIAIVDTHFNELFRILPKLNKESDDIKYIQKKLKRIVYNIPNLPELVNVPIKKKLKE